MSVEVIHGDCLDVMRGMADASVDAVIADLPYGTTACKWDAVIPLKPLWVEYGRVAKPNAAIVLTASQPFTSTLVMSNPSWFRYEWIWEKTVGSNPLVVKSQPFKKHESVLVFYRKSPTYNIQWERGEPYTDRARPSGLRAQGGASGVKLPIENDGRRYPSSVQRFPNPNNGSQHPTQKPVALMEYLVRTYSNPGDVVLDNTCGSGTTGVACVRTGRCFIGIEREAAYVEIARKRIADARSQLSLGVA